MKPMEEKGFIIGRRMVVWWGVKSSEAAAISRKLDALSPKMTALRINSSRPSGNTL